MFSGWVGDQDADFGGLQDALGNMMWSAWYNYTNYGSDIGGYRGGKRTAELLLRWAQVGALLPLMENGGENPHAPWFYEADENSTIVSDIYRKFVILHYELLPYFISIGTKSFEEGRSVQTPSEPFPSHPYDHLQPSNFSTYAYKLGDSVFYAPVT